MGNLFSYENPIMQALMKLGDLMILNFIYLGCCIPIFTIGAAQAGLYTAMKVMHDPEDDTSLVAAFFRGFKAGFGKVTLAWGLASLVMAAVTFTCYIAALNRMPLWLCAIPIAICAWCVAMIPVIHSRLGCTAWQLVRNVWFFVFAHPLRTLGVAILTWLPVGILLGGNIYSFMVATPIWTTLYYSTAASIGYAFMKKPFRVIIEHFEQTQAKQAEAEKNALPEGEAEEAAEETPV